MVAIWKAYRRNGHNGPECVMVYLVMQLWRCTPGWWGEGMKLAISLSLPLTDSDNTAQSTSEEYKPMMHTHLIYFLVYTYNPLFPFLFVFIEFWYTDIPFILKHMVNKDTYNSIVYLECFRKPITPVAVLQTWLLLVLFNSEERKKLVSMHF